MIGKLHTGNTYQILTEDKMPDPEEKEYETVEDLFEQVRDGFSEKKDEENSEN